MLQLFTTIALATAAVTGLDFVDDLVVRPQIMPRPTCASTLCKVNTICVDGPFGAECRPNNGPRVTCANMLCMTPSTCVETPAGPQCQTTGPTTKGPNTCSVMKCAANQECVEFGDRGARCVPKRNITLQPDLSACATMRCAAGTHCVETEMMCIRQPCRNRATCGEFIIMVLLIVSRVSSRRPSDWTIMQHNKMHQRSALYHAKRAMRQGTMPTTAYVR